MADEWLANYKTEWAAQRGSTLTPNEIVICNELISDDPNAPYDLEHRYRRGEIRPAVAGLLAVDIWTRESDRQQHSEITDYAVWRAMFRHRGFTRDSFPAERPNRSLVLFRGSTPAGRTGISWSRDPGQALYFARNRQLLGERAVVWAARVEPHRMLAEYSDGWEVEVVVDARRLPMTHLRGAKLTNAIKQYQRRSGIQLLPRVRAPTNDILSVALRLCGDVRASLFDEVSEVDLRDDSCGSAEDAERQTERDHVSHECLAWRDGLEGVLVCEHFEGAADIVRLRTMSAGHRR